MDDISTNSLSTTLFTKTRWAILSLLYTHPDQAFYLRHILRVAGSGHGAVQRELKQLTGAGFLYRFVEGRRVYFQANAHSPVFEEVKGLVNKVKDAAGPSAQSGAASEPPYVLPVPLRLPRKRLADFCRRNHITKLSFFGSVLRDDFRPDSDIDVLVEFEPGKTPGYFRLYDMEMDLSKLFGGRKVDLRTPADLSRYFRQQVMDEARVAYGSTG